MSAREKLLASVPLPERASAATNEAGASAQPKPARRVLHERFSWVPPASRMRGRSVGLHEYAQLACEAHDVARGIKVVLGMLEQDRMDESFQDDAGAPLPQLLSLRCRDSHATAHCLQRAAE